MHITYNMHVAHSVHVACQYWLGNMYVACMLPKMQHVCSSNQRTPCHMQVPGNNNNSIKKHRFCSSLSQTCVGSCDSLSQPCAKIPVCHQVRDKVVDSMFLVYMLVQPCHFCMGGIDRCIVSQCSVSRLSSGVFSMRSGLSHAICESKSLYT